MNTLKYNNNCHGWKLLIYLIDFADRYNGSLANYVVKSLKSKTFLGKYGRFLGRVNQTSFFILVLNSHSLSQQIIKKLLQINLFI